MSTKSKKRVHGVHRGGTGSLSRKKRKHVARQAERFNRLLDLAHRVRMTPAGTHAERLSRSNAIEKEAHALWEKIQRTSRRRAR